MVEFCFAVSVSVALNYFRLNFFFSNHSVSGSSFRPQITVCENECSCPKKPRGLRESECDYNNDATTWPSKHPIRAHSTCKCLRKYSKKQFSSELKALQNPIRTDVDCKCYFYLIIKIPRCKIVDYNLITANKYRTQSGCKTAKYQAFDRSRSRNKHVMYWTWCHRSMARHHRTALTEARSLWIGSDKRTYHIPANEPRCGEKKFIIKLHKIIVERISIAWNVFSQMDFCVFLLLLLRHFRAFSVSNSEALIKIKECLVPECVLCVLGIRWFFNWRSDGHFGRGTASTNRVLITTHTHTEQ